MYPDKILGIFHLYGLMIGIGILACFGILTLCCKKFKIEEKFVDFVFFNGVVSIVVGFGSAALFQAIYNYIEDPSAGFHFGGITFLGGLIGGAATFLILYFIARKRYKARLIDILSIVPCCILIAHGFGRIGCLFAGCCHGAPTDAWYGIYMHTSKYGYAKVVPTQLFEALFLFALFAVCFLLLWKKKFRYNMSVYLIGYGFFRYCNEMLRDDHRGQLLGSLSPSQVWSIVMIVGGVALIFVCKYLFRIRDEQLAKQAEAVKAETPSETEETETRPSHEIVWRDANAVETDTTDTDSEPTERPEQTEPTEPPAAGAQDQEEKEQ